MKKGQIALGIGMLVFSITLFLEHAFGISGNLTDFVMGFGCGIILLGTILTVIENRKEKGSK